MPFHTECPDCEAGYNLPDTQEGRRVRCKKCGAAFTADPVEENESSGPVRVEKGSRSGTADGGEKTSVAQSLKHIPVPWLVGGIVACVGLVTAGAVVIAVILKPSTPERARQPERTPVAEAAPVPVPVAQPVAAPAPPSAETPAPPAPAPASSPAPAVPAAAAVSGPSTAAAVPTRGDGRITAEARDRVKHATVYIQVTFGDGRQVSGSGFFGSSQSPNIILTNAHVLGMLAPESHPPKKVEIVINSGEANMKRTTARVLGVDRNSDLAVLDVGKSDGLPTPLAVKSASGLQELDSVYVFGFPFGKSFGEEITIRPSSVSALRKRNGVVDKVQVAGGMDHGNSGGPVVDSNGDVVGVAVSGVEGSLINFAIPGERVTSILDGQFSTKSVGLVCADAGRLTLPIELEMIDPRGKIKTVAMDVWTGDRGQPLAADTKEPAARAGDSTRQHVELQYSAGVARGELPLPELPAGKVYWLQPVYVNQIGKQWAAANPFDFKPELVIERKPANLRVHAPLGSSRQLSVVMKNSFRVTADDDHHLEISRIADFIERVAGSDGDGRTLRLEYKRLKHEQIVDQAKPVSDPLIPQIEPFLPYMVLHMRTDPRGNPKGDLLLDSNSVAGGIRQLSQSRTGGGFGNLGSNGQEIYETLKSIAVPTEHALQALAVSLPNEDNCQPGKSWHASGDRSLPLETQRSVESPRAYENGHVTLTYTYLGTRTHHGKPEAVIAIEGSLSDKDGGEAIWGQVSGWAAVDIGTGVATHSELTSVVDLEVTSPSGKTGRAIATLSLRAERTSF
jgi:predicted Zn finger-like uncharacterized protein